MTRHVHFCSIGKEIGPPLTVCNSHCQRDMIYYLNSPPSDDEYTRNEAEVYRRLHEVNINNVETIYVDVYDFESICEGLEKAINQERSRYSDCFFHFNITAGSNICAGAMCVVAMSTEHSDIYHVKDGRLCRPPVEGDIPPLVVGLADIESVIMLENKVKDASIVQIISQSPDISHRELLDRTGMSPSLLSYHLKNLQQYGLIEKSGDNGRSPNWILTEKGRKVYRRYRIRNEI